MNTLGDKIRKLRLEKGLPLRKVAAYLDIDQAILSKMERGMRKISREQTVKLSEILMTEEKDLLVEWLSDRIVYDVADDNLALEALKVAEEKVLYNSYRKAGNFNYENKIKEFLVKDGRISKAWLFGSYARGEADFKSDIDILIEVPLDVKFTLFDLADIQYYLENLINKKVDLLMREGVKPSIMERIRPELKLIYER